MGADYQAGNPPGYLARHESGDAAAYLALDTSLDYVTIVGYGSQPRPRSTAQTMQITDSARLAAAQAALAAACRSAILGAPRSGTRRRSITGSSAGG